MNIKELLLEGCRISMPYKTDPNEWVGEIKIFIFEGGCGAKPKIIIDNAKHREWKLDQLDDAIKYFKELVFNSKNLMYKMNETVIGFTSKGIDIDLDETNDYLKVRNKIKETLNI